MFTKEDLIRYLSGEADAIPAEVAEQIEGLLSATAEGAEGVEPPAALADEKWLRENLTEAELKDAQSRLGDDWVEKLTQEILDEEDGGDAGVEAADITGDGKTDGVEISVDPVDADGDSKADGYAIGVNAAEEKDTDKPKSESEDSKSESEDSEEDKSESKENLNPDKKSEEEKDETSEEKSSTVSDRNLKTVKASRIGRFVSQVAPRYR